MSTVNFELFPSQAVTASVVGATIDVSGIKEMEVFPRITAGSGTLSALSLYLEGSDDGGTTFYELVADTVLKNTGLAADPTVNSAKRNIITETAIVTSETKWTAQYTRFPDKVRVRIIITPTAAPSETVGVKAVGKT